jgi:type II secretory pathway pseudopilin PulG
MTLIELIIVIGIVALLAGALSAVLAQVRHTAQRRTTLQTLGLLQQAFATYRLEDSQRRFPPVDPIASVITSDVLGILVERRYFAPAQGACDADGALLDAWRTPLRYALSRPDAGVAPPPATQPLTAPAMRDGTRFPTWNWDPRRGRERAWGRRWDAAAGVEREGPLPHAYLWSWGRGGSATDASAWIHPADGTR